MTTGTAAIIPRFLVRRLFAFLIDQLIVWSLLFSFVHLTGRDRISITLKDPVQSTFHSQSLGPNLSLGLGAFVPVLSVVAETCGEVRTMDQGLLDYFAPSRVTSAKACWTRVLGLPRTGTLEATLQDPAKANATTETIELTFFNPVIAYQDGVALVLFIVLSAACGGLIGTTPGKFIAGLRIAGRRCELRFSGS
jgi:hypothetical protein